MVVTLFIYLLCLVCWLGAIIFFSGFVAPTLFTQLPVAEAGKVVSVIFPRYYILGYVAGIVTLVIAIYFAAVRGPRGWWSATAAVLAIALALTFYAGAVVRPKVDSIRTVAEQQNPDPARKAEFDRLHRLSVMLNGTILILELIALAGTAAALTRNA
jgi:Domain of unknown function (DUF4149)